MEMTKEVRERLAAEVRIEDLREICPTTLLIVEAIGPEAFVELAHALGGISVYIPKFESVIAAARDRVILREFKNSNYTELALKYGISEVWVRKIVNRQRAQAANDNSISLFDELPKAE